MDIVLMTCNATTGEFCSVPLSHNRERDFSEGTVLCYTLMHTP